MIVTREANKKLTGRVRFRASNERKGLLAKQEIVVLSVEEEFDRAQYNIPPRNFNAEAQWKRYSRWRDATPLDLADIKLRWLIDGDACVSCQISPSLE